MLYLVERFDRVLGKVAEKIAGTQMTIKKLSTQFKPDTLIDAPPSPPETRARRFWRARIDQQQISKSRISSDRPFAETDAGGFARRLPFHFGSETQCLQHSSCPPQPRLAGGLATLPSIGRTGSADIK
jgi:hypothetical protein